MAQQRSSSRSQQQDDRGDGLKEKMIGINRVTKVVKGGRILGFAALTVVGDGDGKIGMGKGKAREVPVAVQKAMDEARRKMAKISLKGGTLQHTVFGRHGASYVFLAPAPQGTGIIPGGGVLAVVESCRIHTVLTNSLVTANPHNVVRATLQALEQLRTPEDRMRAPGRAS